MTVLCRAIFEGDFDYCKEWVSMLSLALFKKLLTSFISLHVISILDAKPELANGNHPSVLTALQVAIMDRKPANVDPIMLQSTVTLPCGHVHGAMCESTPLHYACLLGDMKVAEVLLRNGADWTISDCNNLLPEDYVCINCDGTMREFKHLCEVQMSKRREEEGLIWAGMFAEELELEREEEKKQWERQKRLQAQLEKKKKLEESVLNWAGRFGEKLELEREEQKKELERIKKLEKQNELEKKRLEEKKMRELEKRTKLEEEEFRESEKKKKLEELRELEKKQKLKEEEESRRKKQCEWFPFSSPPAVLTDLC